MKTHPPKISNPVDSPTAWFCELESARIRHDTARAARAEKELARLGVKVVFSAKIGIGLSNGNILDFAGG